MALFAALTAVGAFITIPVPPVPFSLQIFFAILAGALLGSRQGAMSIVNLSAAGIVRAAGLYQGSGLVLPTSADLWLSAGICSGSMAVRKNHRGSKKQQLSDDAGGLFFDLLFHPLPPKMYL